MTVSSTGNKAQFPGAGTTGPFPFDFKVFAQSDLEVIQTDASDVETTLTLTTDYTVSLNADQNNDPGGSVSLVAALPVGELLTVVRNIEATQETDIANGGGFYPEAIENALDKLTMLTQQNTEAISRSVKTGVGSASTPDELIESVFAHAAGAAASASAADASADAAAASAVSADASADASAQSAIDAAAAVGGVKATSTDTTPSNLSAKIIAGPGVTLTTQNPTGNATITIKSVGANILLASKLGAL